MDSDSDKRRVRSLYQYIVNSLIRDKFVSETDLGKLLSSEQEHSNHRAIGRALKEGRSITVAKLSKYLQNLKLSLTERRVTKGDDEFRPLTAEQVLLAFQKLVQLTPEEREGLGLASDDRQILLQQILLNLNFFKDCATERQSYEQILALYKASIELKGVQEDGDPLTNIQDFVQHYLASLFNISKERARGFDVRLMITEKAKRAIKKIWIASGSQQTYLLSFSSTTQNEEKSCVERHLSFSSVKELARTVVDNELLLSEFPIYIKTVTLQPCGPFPLPVAVDSASYGLLHKPILEQGGSIQDVTEIAAHYARQIIVHFYLYVPKGYTPLNKAFERRITREGTGRDVKQRLDFSVSSTGIGGTLAHIIKIINTALFFDVEVLKDYFPIAHDVLINQKITRNNTSSSAWSHNLIKLCRNDALAKAMRRSLEQKKLVPYEICAFDDPVGRGDYCEFDLLYSAAKSALQARLHAIQQAGLNPEQYLTDLCRRIEQNELLEESCSYVDSYPFSSLAQSSKLHTQLLADNIEFTKSTSYLLFDAYLTLAETYLGEGAYRMAWYYLDAPAAPLKELSLAWVQWYQNISNSNCASGDTSTVFEIFSGAILARFEFCRALYFYVVDTAEECGRTDYLPSYVLWSINNERRLRQNLVNETWKALRQAEQHLATRLAKYCLINEVSQGTFHPYYYLLSQIYFLRARLFFFFPHDVPEEKAGEIAYIPKDNVLRRAAGEHSSRTSQVVHANRLHLLEKARLYAASDGSNVLYVHCTAYQCWAYLMAAFEGKPIGDKTDKTSLTAEQCFAWAQRLRDHALSSYSEIGRRCYLRLKEKSGISRDVKNYGNYRIEPIKPIRELVSGGQPKLQDEVLHLDMSFLVVRQQDLYCLESDESHDFVYLFGPQASYLFFIRGMYHLCSSNISEFNSDQSASSRTDWNTKLKHTYHLFNYAWAIADDGGELEIVDQENHQYYISREYMDEDPHVASVRDLYPHRISEIAELGRLFAAACAVLLLYCESDNNEHERLNKNIDQLLSELQQKKHCEQEENKRLLLNQPRYGGHLTSYLEQCKEIFRNERLQVQLIQEEECDRVGRIRQEFVKKLFEAMLYTPSS